MDDDTPLIPASASSAAVARSRAGLLALLVSALLLLLFSHPLVHGDGVSYLVYLDSVAGDGDLDLSNQAERFEPAIVYPYSLSPTTGTPVTPFPFGLAYLLAPFYWLARALEPLLPALRAHPEHFTTIQGLSLAYSLMAVLGALLYALATVWLSFRAASRVAPGWAAGLAALACLAGTPQLYYATIEPLTAHLYGAFALALALWLAGRGRRWTIDDRRWNGDANRLLSAVYRPGIWLDRNWLTSLAVGLALGLSVLVRWQLLLYALPIGVALTLPIHGGAPSDTEGRTIPASLGAPSWTPKRGFRRQVRQLSVIGLAFAVGLGLYCAACALYFWRFFGRPLVVPNDVITGQVFVGEPLRYLPQVLFWNHNGWLSWSPIAVLGLAGLLGIAWRGAGLWRWLALASLVGITLEVAINASTADWYAGWSFGQRRMAEAYPLLVVGVAWLLGRARGRRLAVAATSLCAAYSVLLLVAHLYYTHTSGHPEGGGVGEVLGWLLSGPHGPSVAEVFRDRYGPWAWDKPEP
jgi:hypothetical protein